MSDPNIINFLSYVPHRHLHKFFTLQKNIYQGEMFVINIFR